jgi:hypothetical protein
LNSQSRIPRTISPSAVHLAIITLLCPRESGGGKPISAMYK